MIPIASTTNLSIEKTAKLLQNLLELRNTQNVDLPERISRSVDNLLLSQQTLIQEIDKYLHRTKLFKDNQISTVTKIVKKCPEFLATKDKFGRIPFHVEALRASSSAKKYLLLFADIGYQHKIGGDENRGGLLLPDDNGHNALNFITDPEVFDALQKHDPPLFFIEDVQKYELIHNAAEYHTLDLVKYFYSLDPSCLYQLDENNELPIHHAIDRDEKIDKLEIVRYLLQQSVSYNVSNESIGGLFIKMSDREELVLDVLVKEWGREKVWNCIEKAISPNSSLHLMPILHQTIRHRPTYCSEVINRFPGSVHVQDPNNSNRLPIHVALETGMKFSIELTCLLTASQEHLKEVDPVTKWPPFVLAGMGSSCDLITIYRLLLQNPSHLETWSDGEKQRRSWDQDDGETWLGI